MGFNNALIWFPFIQKAVEKAATVKTLRFNFSSSSHETHRMERYTVQNNSSKHSEPSEERVATHKKGFSILTTGKQIHPVSLPEVQL